MESRVIIGDLLTGRNIHDLSTISHRWENLRNAPETLSCTINLADPTMRALGLRNAATAGKTYLAILLGDKVMASGPMERPRYGKAGRTLELRAEGWGSYFRRRTILPAVAQVEPLIDPATGEPNPLTNTVLAGWSLGTIMKKVIQQSMEWPGGNLPIIFQDDEPGTHEDTIRGSDLKKIYTLFENYAARDNGPDWEFAGQLTTDRLGIEVMFRTGTETQPRLQSESVHEWDYSVPEPGLDDLYTEIDSSEMTGLAWTTGGRSVGGALVASAFNADLIDAGFPLYESVDADHSTASEQTTLQSYSDERIRVSGAPTEFWPFRVRTDRSPFPGEYKVGDRCDLHVRNDDFIPDGKYRREIASLAGDENLNWITVTTAEAPLG